MRPLQNFGRGREWHPLKKWAREHFAEINVRFALTRIPGKLQLCIQATLTTPTSQMSLSSTTLIKSWDMVVLGLGSMVDTGKIIFDYREKCKGGPVGRLKICNDEI